MDWFAVLLDKVQVDAGRVKVLRGLTKQMQSLQCALVPCFHDTRIVEHFINGLPE